MVDYSPFGSFKVSKTINGSAKTDLWHYNDESAWALSNWRDCVHYMVVYSWVQDSTVGALPVCWVDCTYKWLCVYGPLVVASQTKTHHLTSYDNMCYHSWYHNTLSVWTCCFGREICQMQHAQTVWQTMGIFLAARNAVMKVGSLPPPAASKFSIAFDTYGWNKDSLLHANYTFFAT